MRLRYHRTFEPHNSRLSVAYPPAQEAEMEIKRSLSRDHSEQCRNLAQQLGRQVTTNTARNQRDRQQEQQGKRCSVLLSETYIKRKAKAELHNTNCKTAMY